MSTSDGLSNGRRDSTISAQALLATSRMSETAATTPKKRKVGRSPCSGSAPFGSAAVGDSPTAGSGSAAGSGASTLRGASGSFIGTVSYDTLRGSVEFAARADPRASAPGRAAERRNADQYS